MAQVRVFLSFEFDKDQILPPPLQRSDMSIVYVRFGVFRSSGAVCNTISN